MRIIKICGITSRADAQEALEAGANAVGFNFYRKSPRYVTPAAARLMAAELGRAVLRVGVFVEPDWDEVLETQRLAGLDVVQIHGTARTGQGGFRLWRAVSVGEAFQADELGRIDADAVLLDAPSESFGGSGQTFDWRRAARVRERVIVAGGLHGGNVAAAIHMIKPWGVDACSQLEAALGKKDIRKVREFVAAARTAFAQLEAGRCASRR